MELTELELIEKIKKQVTEGIAPYLKVQRPEGETGSKDKPLWNNLGGFLQSVVRHDKLLAEYCEKTLSMDSDPAGGYLVPEKWLPGILKVASEDGIVRSRATVIPAGTPPDAELNIPVLNQAGTAGAHAMFAGVWFQWTNEGGPKPDKEPEFDTVKLAPEEYSASTILTDKIIRNAPALEAFVKAIYSRAQVAFEDHHFLTGTGVNQPLGVINSPAYIQCVRAGAGIVYADIMLIMARIIPGGKYEWVISRSAYGDICGLVDAVGNMIFIGGDITKAVPDRLLGYPIRWTFRVPALGTMGDISLVDLSYYLIKDGFGPAFDTSKHVYFVSNKTVLKMFSNVDGQPWVSGTITAEDGATTISPFVGLEDD